MSARDRPTLIVVGGGIAGWTAARRAQRLGVDVTLVERSEDGPGFGNTRISGGYFHAAYRSPRLAEAELYARAVQVTDGFARPELARTWARNCGRALAFLESEGAEFTPAGSLEWTRTVLEPHSPDGMAGQSGLEWRGRGPDVLLQRMAATFTAAGGTYLPGRRARAITHEPECVRVSLEDADGKRSSLNAGSLLLADGGFQGDRSLVRQHIGTDKYLLRGSQNDTGDGFRMGLDIGAATAGLPWFYGHVQHRDALKNERLWPHPTVDAVVETCLVVDAAANRIGVTGQDFLQVAHEIVRSATPADCWVIADRSYWDGPLRASATRLNPRLEQLGASVVSANSLEELARLCSLPVDALGTAVQTFNRQIEVGGDSSRETVSHAVPSPVAFTGAQFVAMPLIVGITFAMGGLLVDARARVVGHDGSVIRGVFAAGGTMGGLQGGPRVGYLGGWSEAAVFGLVAAETIGRLN